MIPVNKLVDVFNSMIGWPYATPGYNDSRGVDCSGAFVYAYKQFGESIYHGSNRIIRVYCHDVKTVTSASQLRVGMAIFKSRTDLSKMKAEYKPGGRYYDPALPYDYYHVGLVTSVNPLKIVNATPPVVRVDTNLSVWCCAGWITRTTRPSRRRPLWSRLAAARSTCANNQPRARSCWFVCQSARRWKSSPRPTTNGGRFPIRKFWAI